MPSAPALIPWYSTSELNNINGEGIYSEINSVKEMLAVLVSETRDSSINRNAAAMRMYNLLMSLSAQELREQAMWKEGEEKSVLHRLSGPYNLPLDAIDRLADALGVDFTDNDAHACSCLFTLQSC
jgi:hypothetical protein